MTGLTRISSGNDDLALAQNRTAVGNHGGFSASKKSIQRHRNKGGFELAVSLL